MQLKCSILSKKNLNSMAKALPKLDRRSFLVGLFSIFIINKYLLIRTESMSSDDLSKKINNRITFKWILSKEDLE